MMKTFKPPYRVPSMQETLSVPWNGLTVASTFSGAGGSCLGYRMAGFKVLWANEFIPAAQKCYRDNHPDSILDTRDVRDVQPEEILSAINCKKGELDLLDGSPPCQAFSTAGIREKGWGKAKTYEHGVKQCNETLFDDYVRLLKGIQPKVFVAENVSGLIKGVAKGFFKLILKSLRDCGYRVEAKLLDAQWLGVPQVRQRIIFIGVRDDLKLDPMFPKPFPYRYSVREALSDLYEEDKEFLEDTHGQWGKTDITHQPSTTVRAKGVGQLMVTGPDISRYAIGDEWDRLKEGDQSDKYFNLVKPDRNKPSPTITKSGGNLSIASVVHPTEKRKFTIDELKRICAFPDDFIMAGTYTQNWERLGNSVPPLMMKQVAETIRNRILLKTPLRFY